jgi:hypothetical protein
MLKHDEELFIRMCQLHGRCTMLNKCKMSLVVRRPFKQMDYNKGRPYVGN